MTIVESIHEQIMFLHEEREKVASVLGGPDAHALRKTDDRLHYLDYRIDELLAILIEEAKK